MHWLTVAKWLAGAVAALGGYRWLFRPARDGWRSAMLLLRQIRDSSRGVQDLALEVRGLSGSVIRLVVAMVEEHQILRADHAELRERLSDHAELIVDLAADVRRLEKRSDDEPK